MSPCDTGGTQISCTVVIRHSAVYRSVLVNGCMTLTILFLEGSVPRTIEGRKGLESPWRAYMVMHYLN